MVSAEIYSYQNINAGNMAMKGLKPEVLDSIPGSANFIYKSIARVFILFSCTSKQAPIVTFNLTLNLANQICSKNVFFHTTIHADILFIYR